MIYFWSFFTKNVFLFFLRALGAMVPWCHRGAISIHTYAWHVHAMHSYVRVTCAWCLFLIIAWVYTNGTRAIGNGVTSGAKCSRGVPNVRTYIPMWGKSAKDIYLQWKRRKKQTGSYQIRDKFCMCGPASSFTFAEAPREPNPKEQMKKHYICNENG